MSNLLFIANILIALVWLVNGLFCKVLNLTPRHRAIVGRIIGEKYAASLTIMIGIAEVAVGGWIISGLHSTACKLFQICIIMTMNIIEFSKAPELLLYGKLNIVFAALFCLFLLYVEIAIR